MTLVGDSSITDQTARTLRGADRASWARFLCFSPAWTLFRSQSDLPAAARQHTLVFGGLSFGRLQSSQHDADGCFAAARRPTIE